MRFLLLLLFLFPSVSFAAETLDAYYDTGDDTAGNLTDVQAQTWTALSTSDFSSVDLLLTVGGCAGGDSVSVYIVPTTLGIPNSGDYTNIALRKMTVDCGTMSGTSWIKFTATSTLAITSGTVYTIVAKSTSASGPSWRVDTTAPTSYTDGVRWYCSVGACTTWAVDGAGMDDLFRVYVMLAVATPTPLDSFIIFGLLFPKQEIVYV